MPDVLLHHASESVSLPRMLLCAHHVMHPATAAALAAAGIESFELELGPWSVLGNKALSTTSYVPDFSAVRPHLL